MVGKAVSPLLKRAKFDDCSLCVVVMNCKNIRRGVGFVKSNMVYTLCKHMVYMLSITNEHKK